jgi:hypothetical protein
MMALLSVGWFGLFGSAPVGRLHYAGQRGLELVELLHLCVICFHQIGMIASKKLRHPYHFAARIASEPCVLVCVCFVSYVNMKILMVLVQLV